MERDQDYSRYQVQFEHSCMRDESFKQESQFKNQDGQEEVNFLPERIERRAKKNLRDQQVQLLNKKKKNLQDFIHTIGDSATDPIREDILEHCGRLSDNIPHNLKKAMVMKLVENRVNKMIKNKRIKKNWSEEDINILVWVISKYCQYHGISCVKEGITQADWITIANMIPGVTGKTCMFKWLSLKKSNLAQNSWIQQESLLLDEMVKKYGQNNWCLISQELYLRNPFPNKVYRCPKQCREHWNCYLNPHLKKGPWEKKQDYLLLRAVKQLQGVKKWAEIVKLFNGRTENALKNRFTLIVQKQTKDLKNKKKFSEIQLVEHYLRRHENHYSLDQPKLKFLSEKRTLINETQAKRKPKKKVKNTKSKSKSKQIEKQDMQDMQDMQDIQDMQEMQDSIYSDEEEEQYMPVMDTYLREKPSRMVTQKSRAAAATRTEIEDRMCHDYRMSPVPHYPHYERDSSINHLRSVKKSEQIFYSSDSQEESIEDKKKQNGKYQKMGKMTKQVSSQEQVKQEYQEQISSPKPTEPSPGPYNLNTIIIQKIPGFHETRLNLDTNLGPIQLVGYSSKVQELLRIMPRLVPGMLVSKQDGAAIQIRVLPR